jgi:hypothetical protein
MTENMTKKSNEKSNEKVTEKRTEKINQRNGHRESQGNRREKMFFLIKMSAPVCTPRGGVKAFPSVQFKIRKLFWNAENKKSARENDIKISALVEKWGI